jgi:hypothetical protein
MLIAVETPCQVMEGSSAVSATISMGGHVSAVLNNGYLYGTPPSMAFFAEKRAFLPFKWHERARKPLETGRND